MRMKKDTWSAWERRRQSPPEAVREGRCGSLGVRGVAHTKGEGLVEKVCGKKLVFTADPGVEIAQKESGVSGEGGVEGDQGIVDQGQQERKPQADPC